MAISPPRGCVHTVDLLRHVSKPVASSAVRHWGPRTSITDHRVTQSLQHTQYLHEVTVHAFASCPRSSFEEILMRKQYLHLSAYPCDACGGPVIAGSLAVRENEISKETDIRQVGAICLSCGNRQSAATPPARARHLLPMDWTPVHKVEASHLTTAFVEALNRVDLD
jgi:hypothetical protein